MTLLYVLVQYNINKYFIEYPKHQLFVCYNGEDSYLNLIINHCDNEYVFVKCIYGSSKICEAVKKELKLREKDDALYSVICMIVNQFVMEVEKGEKDEFKYTLLPEKDKYRKIRIEDYPSIWICTNDNYYDTYAGIILYNRIKTKLPVAYFDF